MNAFEMVETCTIRQSPPWGIAQRCECGQLYTFRIFGGGDQRHYMQYSTERCATCDLKREASQ